MEFAGDIKEAMESKGFLEVEEGLYISATKTPAQDGLNWNRTTAELDRLFMIGADGTVKDSDSEDEG